MHVVITGGAGYIGTVLTQQLLSAGASVTCFDNLLYGQASILPFFNHPLYHFMYGDVSKSGDVEMLALSAFRADTVVVHLAGLVGAPVCEQYPRLAHSTHVEGTRYLVEALHPNQHLVFAATGSEYGKVDGVCTEDSPLSPLSVYGITKAKAEEIALTKHHRTTAFRFATAFGPSMRMRFDLLVNDFTRQMLQNRRVDVYQGAAWRTFLHVQDIARAIRHAIDGQHIGVFNCGDERLNLTKLELAQKIQKQIPDATIGEMDGSDPDQRDYVVSYEKFAATGYRAKWTLDRGINELIRVLPTIPNGYSNMVLGAGV